MNTPLKTRAAAFVASLVITFTTVGLIAAYAYPQADDAIQFASAAR